MKFQEMHQDAEMLYPIDLMLTTAQAMALAHFVKRFGWSEFRAAAVDDAEAKDIRDGVEGLQNGLATSGFASLL
jgi:hypothetical protein